MSNFSLGEAVLGTGVDLKGLRSGMQQAKGESQGLWSRVTRVAENALGFMTGDLLSRGVDAVVNLGRELGDTLLNEAPAFQQLETSFENLAESAGQNSQEILESMREASDGMVNDADLMTSYNQAMLLVGDSMADKFPKLLEIARASAAATGEDVGFMLDSLVKGIGRGSPMILDNLGLTINLAEANQEYADSMGIAVDEMTKAQEQEALLNAVTEAGAGFVERLGDNTGGAAATIAQLRTTFENLKMDLATALLPALVAILEPLADLAMEYGPRVAEWAAEMVPHIEDLAYAFGAFLSGSPGDFPWEDIFPPGLADTMYRISDTFERVRGSIQTFFDLVRSGTSPLDAMRTALMNALGPTAGSKVSATVTEIVSFVQSIVGQLVTWFQANLPLIQQTGQTLATFWQTRIVPALDNAWVIITTMISTNVSLITGIITAAMQIINGDWAGAWQTIKTTAATVWAMIKTIITQFIEGILNSIGTNLAEFKAMWRNNFAMAKIIATNIFERIKTAITQKIQGAKTSVITAVEAIKTFISGFDLAGVGRSMIQGLINGIKEKASQVASAASGVVKGAVEAAKEALRIGSPSRVFWDFGANAGESFSDSLGSKGDDAAGAAGTMVNRAIGGAEAAMAGPGPGGIGGNVEVHVHLEHVEIHDDRDIRELVEEIAEELGEALRQRMLGGSLSMA